MKLIAIYTMSAAALFGAGSANAASVAARVQNSTTAIATPALIFACANPSPTLQTVSAGATTATPSVATCGNNATYVFDYTSGAKVCRFSLNSFYTAPNPITGAGASWAPSASGTSRAGSARCTVTLTSFDNFGNFAWTVRIQ